MQVNLHVAWGRCTMALIHITYIEYLTFPMACVLHQVYQDTHRTYPMNESRVNQQVHVGRKNFTIYLCLHNYLRCDLDLITI